MGTTGLRPGRTSIAVPRTAAELSAPRRPHVSASVTEDELLLLADAQTSGGLLVAGELPGHPVIGELVEQREVALTVR